MSINGMGGHMVASLIHEARFLDSIKFYTGVSQDAIDKRIKVIRGRLKERGYYGKVL